MGLRAQFTMDDLGYAECTSEMGVYIDYSEGCDVFVETFLAAATDMVPVDTGYLQSSIEAYAYGDECVCETYCEYAEYVEYGTAYQYAQPYFEPALDEALYAAMPHWDAAVELALEEEAALIEELEQAEAARNAGQGKSSAQKNQSMRNAAIALKAGGGSFLLTVFAIVIVGILQGLINVVKDWFNGGRSSRSSDGGDLFGFADSIEVEII